MVACCLLDYSGARLNKYLTCLIFYANVFLSCVQAPLVDLWVFPGEEQICSVQGCSCAQFVTRNLYQSATWSSIRKDTRRRCPILVISAGNCLHLKAAWQFTSVQCIPQKGLLFVRYVAKNLHGLRHCPNTKRFTAERGRFRVQFVACVLKKKYRWFDTRTYIRRKCSIRAQSVANVSSENLA